MRSYRWSQLRFRSRRTSRNVNSSRRSFSRRNGGLEALEDRRVLTAVPVISEFLASNNSVLDDEDGDDSDWVELHNAGDTDMSLNRWYLTDDANNLRKWRFPEVNLGAGEYLIVFASGKDRDITGQELHTNFRLSSGGEYLSLVEPDGATIASEFKPEYPKQVTDVSYGIPTGVESSVMLDRGSSARVLVPTDNSLDPSEPDVIQGTWLDPELNDSEWLETSIGVGFVPTQDPAILADSVAEFSGTQGENNWHYGTWTKNFDADGIYQTNDFGAMNGSRFFMAAENRWDLGPNGEAISTQLTPTGGHPSSASIAFFTHWPIRRYVTESQGTITISGTLGNPDGSGDGVVGRIYHNGTEIYSQLVNGTEFEYSVDVDVELGDLIDFAIDPGATDDETGDLTTFTAQVSGIATTEREVIETADSSEDWVREYAQGHKGWYFGMYEPLTDADKTYSPDDFRAFNAAYWTGRRYESPNDNSELQISSSNMYPQASEELIQWPVRRWESTVDGNLQVDWRTSKSSASGDGAVARLYHNGNLVAEREIAGDDRGDETRTAEITGVNVGDFIDLAIDPIGPGATTPDADGDRTRGWMTISRIPDLADSIESDLGSAMRGVASTAYLRIPFNVDDLGALDVITLNMKYDDGFVAYVNGQAVIAENAPDVVGFDSTATEARPLADATLYQSFDLTNDRDVFVVGKNVLQIHMLNADINDDDLLTAAQLTIGTVTAQPTESRFFSTPTPGEPNGLGAAKLGPLVTNASHSPAVPSKGESIVVAAEVSRTFADIQSVNLNYRVMYDDEVSVAMVDDGTGGDATANDGIYTATIPGDLAESGQMIRWYVTATDTDGSAGRLPAFIDPVNSEQYQGTVVDAGMVDSQLPVLHWFVENPNRAAQATGTFGSLFYEGEFYDQVHFELHGQSSSGFPTRKKSMNVDLPNDHRLLLRDDLPRMEDINLLTNFADKSKLRNTLGYEQRASTGGAHHLAFPMRVHQNGEFYAVYDFVEDPDERWLQRIGFDENGSLYKIYNTFNSHAGAEKKARKYEGDGDLRAVVQGVNNRDRDASYDYIFDNINLARMANYLAGFVLTSNVDCCHKNYYAYHDIDGTGEWWFLPWDVDLSNGRVWGGFGRAYFDDTMYSERGILVGGNNALIGKLYNSIPGFREMYFRRVRTLIDEYVKPPGTPRDELPLESRVDELFALFKPDADLDNEKHPATWGQIGFQTFEEGVQILLNEYAEPRRNWLYNTQVMVDDSDVTTIISGEPGATIARYMIPTDNSLGTDWTQLDFDDGTWLSAPTGFGFEATNDNFEELIKTDIQAEISGKTSIYTRIPFTVDDLDSLNGLTLRMKYDDGFVAYINGTEVARDRLRQDEPTFDSTARSRSNRLAKEFENFKISEFMDQLRPGTNVLAIHGINSGPTGNDMLLLPELVNGELSSGGGDIPTAQKGNPKIDFGDIEFAPASGNQGEEYIQLVNNHDFSVDISDWHLTGDVQWTFDPGTVLVAGGTLYATPNAKAFRARSEGPTGGMRLFVQGNYDGNLPNEGGSFQLVAPDGEVVSVANYTGEATIVQENLRISEVMYNPLNPSEAELAIDSSLVSDDFEYIELVNISTSSTIDLSGTQLRNGITFDFDTGSVKQLAPGKRTLVVRNADAFRIRYGDDLMSLVTGEFSLSTGLANEGELITLVDGSGAVVNEFEYRDQVDQGWPVTADGIGSSLEAREFAGDYNDGANWAASNKLHGTPGTAYQAPAAGLRINEFLTRAIDPAVDQIELYNASNLSIDLGNYYLSDASDNVNALQKFKLPDQSLSPGAYIVFDESAFNAEENPNGFGLNGLRGEQLVLSRGNGNSITHLVDFVEFGAAAEGESFGRVIDYQSVIAPMKENSFGAANGEARVGPVVVSEINYAPGNPSEAALALDADLSSEDLEFVEIQNSSSGDVSLKDWRLRLGIDYNFEDDATIASGATLVIVPFNPDRVDNANRTAAFRAHYGIGENVTLVGGYEGQLRDLGEGVRLQRAGQPTEDDPNYIPRLLEDEVVYDESAPWPTDALGSGMSLTRTVLQGLGSDPSNWTAATPSPGSSADQPGDVTGDGVVDATDIDAVCGGRTSGDLQFDLTNDGLVDEADTNFLIQNVLQTSFGDVNLDGKFNSSDLVLIFQAGEYEDNLASNSTWATGDWNCDGDFTSRDFTYALTYGEYDTDEPVIEPAAAAVAAAIHNRDNIAKDSSDKPRQLVTNAGLVLHSQESARHHDAVFEDDTERTFELRNVDEEPAEDLLQSLDDDSFKNNAAI